MSADCRRHPSSAEWPLDPDPRDLVQELCKALGHKWVARPKSYAEVWAEYIEEVERLAVRHTALQSQAEKSEMAWRQDVSAGVSHGEIEGTSRADPLEVTVRVYPPLLRRLLDDSTFGVEFSRAVDRAFDGARGDLNEAVRKWCAERR